MSINYHFILNIYFLVLEVHGPYFTNITERKKRTNGLTEDQRESAPMSEDTRGLRNTNNKIK